MLFRWCFYIFAVYFSFVIHFAMILFLIIFVCCWYMFKWNMINHYCLSSYLCCCWRLLLLLLCFVLIICLLVSLSLANSSVSCVFLLSFFLSFFPRGKGFWPFEWSAAEVSLTEKRLIPRSYRLVSGTLVVVVGGLGLYIQARQNIMR